MAWHVPCARATPGLRRPSLDERSWGRIQVIRGKRIHASLEEHLWVVAAALPRRRCVSLHRGCVGEKDGLTIRRGALRPSVMALTHVFPMRSRCFSTICEALPASVARFSKGVRGNTRA